MNPQMSDLPACIVEGMVYSSLHLFIGLFWTIPVEKFREGSEEVDMSVQMFQHQSSSPKVV